MPHRRLARLCKQARNARSHASLPLNLTRVHRLIVSHPVAVPVAATRPVVACVVAVADSPGEVPEAQEADLAQEVHHLAVLQEAADADTQTKRRPFSCERGRLLISL